MFFVEVETEEELKEALSFALAKKVPPLIIGGGSNLLISDSGYAGLVIKNSLKGIEYLPQDDEVFLISFAGENWDRLVADSVDKDYWGLENLSAIPGTVGATPVQNVGAYGVDVSELIVRLEAININDLTKKEFSKAECEFGYRESFFKSEEGRYWVITKVTYKLSKKPNPRLTYSPLDNLSKESINSPKEIREEVMKIRGNKFPDLSQVGTAGSFFKNPIIGKTEALALKKQYPDLPTYEVSETEVKLSLGWLLDYVCDLRGHCENGVCLYDKQALVLVNHSATSATVLDEFAKKVAKVVFLKTGIEIEREVRFL